jgi:hypothetical protein
MAQVAAPDELHPAFTHGAHVVRGSKVEAACLAKTKLTELTAAEDWQNGSNRGDFGTDWPGYEWSMTVANWTEDTAVRQLDLAVTWRSVGRQRKITLSTLVYPQEQ